MRSWRLLAAAAALGLLAWTLLGPWGSIGTGDGRLYRLANACAEAPAAKAAALCARPEAGAPLLPVAALGGLQRAMGRDALPWLLKGWGAFLALFCALAVFKLASSPGRSRDGWLAVLCLIAGTPLLDRARAGGPELWVLAELLGLALLLARSEREGAMRSILIALLAAAAVATHPYAALALLFLLFVPMARTKPPAGGSRVAGRLWYGWLSPPVLMAALGGLCLFLLVWPGAHGEWLWQHLSAPYRPDHPPLRAGGVTWLQGLDLHGPPWWVTPVMLALSAPLGFLTASLVGLGLRLGRRDLPEGPSLAPLLLLLGAWSTICLLQGSPLADGEDHRAVILGLMAPLCGPGMRALERLCGELRFRPALARLMPSGCLAAAALVVGLLPGLTAALAGGVPVSGLSRSPGGAKRAGISRFARPLLEPAALDALARLPAGSRLACLPWEVACRDEILPGLAVLWPKERTIVPARAYDAHVVIVPLDPTYETPAVLLEDLAAPERAVADVKASGTLLYALRKLSVPPAVAAPKK
jgi:hypothetical protein